MRTLEMTIFTLLLAVSGTAQSGASPVGTITIGDQRWSIGANVQCAIFPGPVVSIAGHAAKDASLEVVIDYGGPTRVRLGSRDSSVSWYAVRDTIEIDIDSDQVRGSATFTEFSTGTGRSANGTFEVAC